MHPAIQKLFWLFRCFTWPLLVVALVFLTYKVGYEIRVHAFENWCAADVRHPFDRSTELMYVDWCEAWWWHPLRALSRVVPAIGAGLLLYWLCGAYLKKSNGGYIVAGVLLTTLPVIKISMFIVSPFRNVFPKGCFFINNSETSCALQLGEFGDQGFYIPILLPLVFWLLYYRKTRAELLVQSAGLYCLKTMLLFGAVGGAIGTVFLFVILTPLGSEQEQITVGAWVLLGSFWFIWCGLLVAGVTGVVYALRACLTRCKRKLEH